MGRKPAPLFNPTVYTQIELPPLIPPYKGGKSEIWFPLRACSCLFFSSFLIKGGNQKFGSLPFIRGGLGWGKTLVNQLFQTCVYTVAI